MPLATETAPPLLAIYARLEEDARYSMDYAKLLPRYQVKRAGDDEHLDLVLRQLRNLTSIADKTRQLVELPSPAQAEPKDPTGELAERAVAVEKVLRGLIAVLNESQEMAKEVRPQTARIRAVRGAYGKAIAAVSALHDAVIDMRWAVMEKDADLEEPEAEPTSDLQHLLARLKGSK
ncbi:MAG: hypothetical protein OXI64_07850 [Defluviicoccus sp.]|nr:hypothetical protein [Defluviicoccus sp.]